MPWNTDEDVAKHKAGLTTKQSAQWRRIANSALKACMKKGGSESECAASAIKQANGVVGMNTNESYDFTDGRNMPMEIKNLLKATYYECRMAWIKDNPESPDDTGSKIRCTEVAWDAVKNEGWETGADGEWVKLSTNQKYSVYKNNDLGEYDVEVKLHQQKPYLVVPVVMMVEGVHHGSHGPLLHKMEDLGKFPEAWNGIPVVIDHPEKEGINVSANAPDIIDTRTVGRVYNARVEGNKLKAEAWLDEDKLNEVSPDILEAVNESKPIEVSVGVFSEEEDVEGEWNGEEYTAIAHNHRPDHLAILTECKGACSIEDGCGIRANKAKDDDEDEECINVELEIKGEKKKEKIKKKRIQKPDFKSGKVEGKDSVEVHADVAVAGTLTRTRFSTNNKNKEDKEMSEVKCTPCVEKKVNELIANSQGRWTDSDREWLQTLEEARLDQLMPTVIEKEVIKEVQVNVLSDEDKAAITAYKKQLKEKRDGIIKTIQDNAGKELWPDAKLQAMDDDTLERVASMIKKEEVGNYALNVSGFSANISHSAEVEPLYPAGVELETKK